MANLNDSAVGCFAQGKEGDLLSCVLDGLFAAGPSASLMGLLLAGVLMTSLYIAGDGTVAVPAVVTILLGVVLVPLLPPQYVSLARTVVIIGTAVAIFAAYSRFTSAGGF